MTKKNFLFLSAAVVATTVAGLAFVVANGINNSAARQLTAENKINGSFTFTYDDNFVSKNKDIVVCRAANDRGTELFFISDNNYPNQITSSNKLIASFGSSSYAQKSFSFFKDAERAEAFTFQNVTSISIGLKDTSANNPSYKIYTDSALTESKAVEGTLTKGTTTEITGVAGATFIKFVPTSSAFMDINSVTINYSCDPEGGSTPVDPGDDPVDPQNTVALKYGPYSMDFVEETIPQLDYEKSSLPTSGEKGKTVTLVIVPKSGYHVYEEDGWYAISDEAGNIGTVTHVSGDTYTFTMPTIYTAAYLGIMIGFAAD